jgi:hypothetical protein
MPCEIIPEERSFPPLWATLFALEIAKIRAMTNSSSETQKVSDKDSLLTKSRLNFKELYIKESKQLRDEVDPKSIKVRQGAAGEPWVAFTPRDRLGLCLSGGGIRSGDI